MKEKGIIYDSQLSLFGNNQRNVIGYSNGFLYVKEIDRNIANDIIIANHYSHKIYNATYIHLGVYVDNELIGVLQYGCAMNPASCSNVVEGTSQEQYLELNRMWLDDKAGKNSESQAISCSVKYIKHKYPKVKWIQSFADERCRCFGIVYQACSFSYYGEHTNIFWYLDGVAYHNVNMTISTKSTRYKNNVGGQNFCKKTKNVQKKLSFDNLDILSSLIKLGKKNVC